MALTLCCAILDDKLPAGAVEYMFSAPSALLSNYECVQEPSVVLRWGSHRKGVVLVKQTLQERMKGNARK